jgi:hypothetical protein
MPLFSVVTGRSLGAVTMPVDGVGDRRKLCSDVS